MTALSNELASRAEGIKLVVAASDAAASLSVEKAIEAGALLVDAKADCGQGKWLPFLDRAGVQERKAQRLMKLAKSGLKSDTVTDLGGVTAALEFLVKRDTLHTNYCRTMEAVDVTSPPSIDAFLDEWCVGLAMHEELIESLPEEQRGALRPYDPAEGAALVIERIAAIQAA